MSKLAHIEYKATITSFVVPYIFGLCRKTPEDAKKYIKKVTKKERILSHPLSTMTFVSENGEDHSFSSDHGVEVLFNDVFIDKELTQIVGDSVYKPNIFLSLDNIFKIELNENMKLIAWPDGVTKDNECIIIYDTYMDRIYGNQEIELKLLSTMAVWRAKRGIYYIEKMKKTICIEFDPIKWDTILSEIKLWASTIKFE